MTLTTEQALDAQAFLSYVQRAAATSVDESPDGPASFSHPPIFSAFGTTNAHRRLQQELAAVRKDHLRDPVILPEEATEAGHPRTSVAS